MDTPKVLTQAEAIDIVRKHKLAIAPLFDGNKVKVYLCDAYSKGNANSPLLYEDVMLTDIAV